MIKQPEIINLEFNRIPEEETSKSDIPPLEAFGLQERVLNSQFYERQAPPRLTPTSFGLPPCGYLYMTHSQMLGKIEYTLPAKF